MKRIEALENELQGERLTVARFWFAFCAWYMVTSISQYRTIFNSMNVELGWMVQAVLAVSVFVADWWLLVLPVAWIGWRTFEDRWLRFQSLRTIRWVSLAAFMTALGLHQLMTMPMLKLINNVG